MVERLAETEDQNRRLQEQLATVQEEERSEIARDLHDEIGPFLFAVDVDAATVQQLVDAGRLEDIRIRIKEIRDSVGHMQKHVKDILARVRPAALTDLGLAHAVGSLVSFWQGRHPGLRFEVDVPPESFGEPVDGTIYRIVQESLSNAVRHGHPTAISIRIAAGRGDEVQVTVSDNGRGMVANGSRVGFGIRGMKERVALLGGTLDVAAASEKGGLAVKACVPLPRQALPVAAAVGREVLGAQERAEDSARR
jgi:two-component system sensor histidine kinase UhpB